MNFIVVYLEKMAEPTFEDDDTVVSEEFDADVTKVVLCKDIIEVSRAVLDCQKREYDWSIWRVNGNKTDRCAVTFHKNLGDGIKEIH